jgi:hypothetical protein
MGGISHDESLEVIENDHPTDFNPETVPASPFCDGRTVNCDVTHHGLW